MARTSIPRPIVGPTGLTVYPLPGIAVESLAIMWAGPGSRLLIGRPTVPGGSVTTIDHPSARDVYATRKDASAAVAVFIAAGSDDA